MLALVGKFGEGTSNFEIWELKKNLESEGLEF